MRMTDQPWETEYTKKIPKISTAPTTSMKTSSAVESVHVPRAQARTHAYNSPRVNIMTRIIIHSFPFKEVRNAARPAGSLRGKRRQG